MTMHTGVKGRLHAHGGWVLRRELEEDVLMSQRAVGQPLESEQRRLHGMCACCRRSFRSERLERGVCANCRVHAKCAKCEQPFRISKDSFGRVCGGCWNELTSDVHLATRLEEMSRDSVAKELYRLAYGTSCACAAPEPGPARRVTQLRVSAR